MNHTIQHLPAEMQRKERTAQFMWTIFILIFFVIQGVIWTVAISITSRDWSHAVVAGYDEQAFNWDKVKQLKADGKKLGWDLKISVGDKGDVRGNHVITLRLHDRSQSPLENAQIEIIAFHRGHAAKKQYLNLESVGSGVYVTNLQVHHNGLWQFSGTAKLGSDLFLFERRIALEANRVR